MRTPAFLRFPLLTTAAAITAGLALGGCSSFSNEPATVKGFLAWIAPYKPDIVQGNVVTKEMAAMVKPGQTRGQVRDVLGSPLLSDAFHVDRWDYVFTIRRQGTPYQQRRVTVLFKNDGTATQELRRMGLPV